MVEETTEPASNVVWGPARSVLQTGTHHGDTHIHAPPQHRPSRLWLAGSALVAGAAIVLVAVMVVLQAVPGSALAGGRTLPPAPVTTPVPTTSSAAPTSSVAPTTPSASSTASSTAPTAPDCSSGTHLLPGAHSSGCVVDNPAVHPSHAEARWPDGGTTVMLIGASYWTYFSTNGEPFTRLSNGFADSHGDGVTFHSTGTRSGYFKLAGGDRRWYCVDFWAEDGKPAEHRIWTPCRGDQ